MFELFIKHLDFVGIPINSLDKTEHNKYEWQFTDPIINKHWLSFYATYTKGYNQAINDVICPLINELKNPS